MVLRPLGSEHLCRMYVGVVEEGGGLGASDHSRTSRSRSGVSMTTTESRRNNQQSSREMFITEVSGMSLLVQRSLTCNVCMHEVVPPCAALANMPCVFLLPSPLHPRQTRLSPITLSCC